MALDPLRVSIDVQVILNQHLRYYVASLYTA